MQVKSPGFSALGFRAGTITIAFFSFLCGVTSLASAELSASNTLDKAVLFGPIDPLDLSTDFDGRVDGAGAFDQAGAAVASSGDINGDGKDDLIIGAPIAANNRRSNSGSAYVLFDSDSAGPIDLNSLGTRGFRIDGAAKDDFAAGTVASADDVNGDGRDDILIGAVANNNGRIDSGSIYVVFGKTSTTPVDLANLGPGGYRIDGAKAQDFAGGSVSGTEDLNGDGLAEVVVGADGADNNGRADSGSIYVTWGKITATSIDLNALDVQGYRIDGAGSGDEAGNAVSAVEDMNGDGLNEMVIGAPNTDNNGRSESGSGYVTWGKATTAGIDLNALGASGFRIDGAAAFNAAGSSIAGAGDFNSDGSADFIIGAPSASNNAPARSGSAYVLFGKGTLTPIDLNALGTGGFRIDGAGPQDWLGSAVAGTGDLNSDDVPDLVLGAPFANSYTRTDSGATFAIYGKSSTATIDLTRLGVRGFRVNGAASNDRSGWSVSAYRDLDGDRHTSFITGAQFADNNGRTDSGSAYIVEGRGPGQ